MKFYITLCLLFLTSFLWASPVYTVKSGDTLTEIAAMYDTNPIDLAVANSIDVDSILKIGQKIQIVRIKEKSDSSKKVLKSSKKEKKSGNTNKNGNSLVNYAMKFKNTPYVYGGTSRGGFDCSGFTSYVYKSVGKTIPRSSAGQFTGGKKIAKKDLQKGDIVCFSIYRSGCSHVGIYIGNGKFIHASNPKKGVIVSELNSGYYKDKFIGGRRY